MPQLPFHRYSGPGNPVDNGIPVDEDDRIAALHDIRYENASSSQDIRDSDRDAIGLFSGDFALTGNWHSAIGALGLTAKYVFESVAGVQYPRSPSGPGSYGDHISKQYSDILKTGKRTSSVLDTPPDTPPKKRPKMDNNEEDQEGMQMDTATTGTGGKTGGGSSTNAQPGSIHRPISNFKTGKLMFLHSRMMFSYGYQFKTIQAIEPLEKSGKQLLVCTPYARVPFQALPFYMTKAEFNNLPIGAEGKRFHVAVTPLGIRTPFITNSAGINSVNSSLLVHGVYAHGLNNKYGGTNMEYTSTAADPMIITGTTNMLI